MESTSAQNNLPKLSIIVAVRNGAATIANTFDSIIAQHYPNTEVLVFDALSNDGTQDIIKKYSSIISAFKSEADKGTADAYNKAIALATGDYIGILNADDEYEPGALWATADAIARNPKAEIVSFGILYRTWDRKKRSIVTGYYADERQLAITLPHVLIENQTFVASRFMKLSLYKELGGFNTDRNLWYYSSDREWMARLALRGCVNAIIPKALYGFTYHKKSMSNNPANYSRIIEEHAMIADALLLSTTITEAQKATVEKWRRRQLVFGFWQSLFAGKIGKAKSFFHQGMETGTWKFSLLCFYLLIRKLVKRAGLKLADGIDRGVFPGNSRI